MLELLYVFGISLHLDEEINMETDKKLVKDNILLINTHLVLQSVQTLSLTLIHNQYAAQV